MTVALLDIVGEQVRAKFGLSEEEMPLVKVLEGGTWKVEGGRSAVASCRNPDVYRHRHFIQAGREIAAKKRPVTRGPPIQILSDGTVF